MAEMKEKECTKCHKVKKINEFIHESTGKDTARCADCRKKDREVKERSEERKKAGKPPLKKKVERKFDESGKLIAQKCNGECGEWKEVTLFAHRKGKSLPENECKACADKYYKRRFEKKKQYMQSEKEAQRTCPDCGFNNPIAFQFAHFERETKARSSVTGKTKLFGSLSLTKMKKERKLVRIICANCHRLETAREWKKQSEKNANKNRKRSERHAFANAEKMKRGECLHCHLKVTDDNTPVFEFDHRDPQTKVIAISTMCAVFSFSLQDITTEMAKCDLLCCNCHIIKSIAKVEIDSHSKKWKRKQELVLAEAAQKKQKIT